MKIVVNGGHMIGMDSGAVGTYLEEAEITLSIMEKLASLLRQRGHEVLSLQSNELDAITEASNGFQADIFISIHCNGSENTLAHGSEVYAMSEEGIKLADCILEKILTIKGTSKRGVKIGTHLYVLKNTDAIANLVETAFITNKEEEQLLANEKDSFALAIADGIETYAKAN